MIRVTQGHENGVGLEIFLKAYLCLPRNLKTNFVLYCKLADLEKTLKSCLPQYEIKGESLLYYGSELRLSLLNQIGVGTSLAIHTALKDIGDGDTLVTLPSSKDQIFTVEGESTKGHTDLFRKLYPKSNIVMSFVSPAFNAALLTDHVSLAEVEDSLHDGYEKMSEAIEGFQKIAPLQEVLIAGIDPHCGEGGLIGAADSKFEDTVTRIKKRYSDLKVLGPRPGDTILFVPPKRERLYIFPSHDQGLAPFKLLNGLTGINLTLGLPFKRVSVDHGTAFDLYGKNEASYQGMIYLLNEVLSWK